MKLLHCTKCKDIKLLVRRRRTCMCGESWGCYVDKYNAIYGGEGILIMIANPSFANALFMTSPFAANGEEFVGAILTDRHPNVGREEMRIVKEPSGRQPGHTKQGG